MRTESPIPACATTHPERRNIMTPKILIITEVKTPSHIPNRTGCEIKNCDFHQGFSPYLKERTTYLMGTIAQQGDGTRYLFLGKQFISLGFLGAITGLVQNGRFNSNSSTIRLTVLFRQSKSGPIHSRPLRIQAARHDSCTAV